MTSAMSRSVLQDHAVVGSYGTYRDAERAVDHLSDQGFPVGGTLIVGADLRLVERVLARQTYLRAAAHGALGGAWFGLLIGIFFGIFTVNTASFLVVVLMGLVWGVVAGALFGLVSHWFTGGARDFISTTDLAADRYEVLVEPQHADRARELLATIR
jgi:hypothetical protein